MDSSPKSRTEFSDTAKPEMIKRIQERFNVLILENPRLKLWIEKSNLRKIEDSDISVDTENGTLSIFADTGSMYIWITYSPRNPNRVTISNYNHTETNELQIGAELDTYFQVLYGEVIAEEIQKRLDYISKNLFGGAEIKDENFRIDTIYRTSQSPETTELVPETTELVPETTELVIEVQLTEGTTRTITYTPNIPSFVRVSENNSEFSYKLLDVILEGYLIQLFTQKKTSLES